MITQQDLKQAGYIFRWPLKQKIVNQGFGENATSFYAQLGLKGHNGVDYYAENDTPVYAMFRGRISFADASDPGYGVNCWVESSPMVINGEVLKLEAVYGHLRKNVVKTGDFVEAGQLLAYSDNSGKYTTGAHLHAGVRPLYERAPGIFTRDENGYWGYIDFKDLLEQGTFPVDIRYGKPRTWQSFLQEQAMAFNPWLRRRIKRLPSNLELKALVYGNWDYEAVYENRVGFEWLYRTKYDS